MFLNKKVHSTCVDFKTQRDRYETVAFNLQEATDEETRDVTLNTTFTIAGGGYFFDIGGTGNSSLTGNTFSHYYSKNFLLISHASVGNGALYVVPSTTPAPSENGAVASKEDPNAGSGHSNEHQPPSFSLITLTPEAAKIKNDKKAFRERCGDGFIATINFGADFYALLTIHETDATKRQQLETSVHTTGGAFGFTASFDGSIYQLIADEQKSKNLAINLVQHGGRIKSLPTNLDELNTKIKELPQEAWEGPEPIYMVVYPYSALVEFQGAPPDEISTALQAALRYYARLQSMRSEILDMTTDLTKDGGSPQYFFESVHRMRSEDLDLLRENVEHEMDRTYKLINGLNQCPQGCKDDENRAKAVMDALGPRIPPLQGLIRKNRVGREQPPRPPTKDEIIAQDAREFDDYLYWINLPLPLNAIPPAMRDKITNPKGDIEEKRQTYARFLYRHWIHRQDIARCSLYNECLDPSQKSYYFNQILSTINRNQSPLPIEGMQVAANAWNLTVQPCMQILITNSKSASLSNSFSLSKLQGGSPIQVIPDQPGDSNVNRTIESVPTRQVFKLEGWFESLGEDYNMWSSSAHYSNTLSTVIWFQDPGSSASIGPNLVVAFQAIPILKPECTPAPGQ
ncbi:hypothetical protein EI171_08335 [Bradyrhizobium sp. LCT2]|uniref:hypothetical protein n=1 Tax=Bradyrhizobium sp. LCT2 TaxID=2493093 RepID=UPI00137455C2|nr:hypothetical protein [Bradyrhizobium sp. LCT2]QHP67435.1 hypothetical protein EI171_08335 [Bradyrhizobium sp. LCT2]